VRKGPGQGREQKMGRRKGKRRERQWRKGRGIGRETVTGKVLSIKPQGGDDISHAVALQLQKEMYEAD